MPAYRASPERLLQSAERRRLDDIIKAHGSSAVACYSRTQTARRSPTSHIRYRPRRLPRGRFVGIRASAVLIPTHAARSVFELKAA